MAEQEAQHNQADIKKQHGGRRPGAGRKTRAEETELLSLLQKHWTPEERANVILALIRTAKDQSNREQVRAAALLFERAYGKPTEYHDIFATVEGVKGYVSVSPDQWPDKAEDEAG